MLNLGGRFYNSRLMTLASVPKCIARLHKSGALCLVLLLQIFASCVYPIQIVDTNVSGLMDLKQSLDPENKVLTTWKEENDCSLWLGVECDVTSGYVISIDLESRNLNGTISIGISRLDSLVTLNLNSNNITGAFPVGVQALENLETLQISPLYGSQGLSGTIPDVFQKLTKLKLINLENNQLEGKIPDSFGNLGSLEVLLLTQNFLTGLNENMKYMTNLKQLNLGQNLFSELLPSYFGEFKDLETLFLFANFFKGPIPDSFANLKNLRVFVLSDNNLNGSIPNFISTFTNLTFLDFSMNRFSGEIPSNIFHLKHLDRITLSENSFSGPIPPSIGNCTGITTLDLSDNRFNGSIPSSIGNLKNLNELLLHGNLLTGTLPKSLGNLKALATLYIYSNKIQGPIPPSLGNLTNLQALILYSNNFSGIIPETFSQLSKLKFLSLSHNRFSGNFSSRLLPNNITTLHLTSCQFEHLSISNQSFTNLLLLDASDNHIHGNLNFSFPPNLQTLQLNKNNISGGINLPKSAAKSLKVLILDENKFSGSLPSLQNFSSLTFFSSTRNKISNVLSSSFLTQNPNLTVLLGSNPLCTLNSISKKLSSQCSTFVNPLLSSFPYDNISSSEIQKNLNLVSKTHPCQSSCTYPRVFSPHAYEQTGTCVCTRPLNVTILLLAPPFSILTQRHKDELEYSMSLDLSESPSTVKINSVLSNTQGKIMSILLFSPDWNDAIYPLYRAPSSEIRFKFSKFSSETLIGPYVYLHSNIEEIMKEEILRQSNEGNNTSNGVYNNNKKKGFPVWVVVLTVVLFILVLSIVIFFLFWRKYKSKLEGGRKPDVPLASFMGESSAESGNKDWQKTSGVKFIPFSVIQAATGGFSDSNFIGSGGYGQVYKGVSLNGDEWAVKRAKITSARALDNFHTEVNAISQMNHKNLVQLLGYCDDEGEQILVYEFIPNGTLRKNLSKKNPTLSVSQRADIAFGLAQALNYLHSFAKQTIVHRDIKSENVLLDSNYQAKLADFGLLKHLPQGESSDAMSTRVAGTPGYLDPEYYETFKVTSASDVYSFGVVLLELVTGKAPVLEDMTPLDESYIVTVGKWALPFVEKGDIHEIIDSRLKEEIESEGNHLFEGMKAMAELAYKCMKRRGKDRPKMDEVSWKLSEIRTAIRNKMMGKEEENSPSNSQEDSFQEDTPESKGGSPFKGLGVAKNRADRELYDSLDMFPSYETSKKSQSEILNLSFIQR